MVNLSRSGPWGVDFFLPRRHQIAKRRLEKITPATFLNNDEVLSVPVGEMDN